MVKKRKDMQYFEGVGRRKEAVARVRLYIVGKTGTVSVHTDKIGKGQIFINHKSFEEWTIDPVTRVRITLPFRLTDTHERFAASILVEGGGMNGQIDAIMHGVSRALLQADPDTYKPLLRQHGLLTRDPRIRERRKVGTGGKARRQKQSPKR